MWRLVASFAVHLRKIKFAIYWVSISQSRHLFALNKPSSCIICWYFERGCFWHLHLSGRWLHLICRLLFLLKLTLCRYYNFIRKWISSRTFCSWRGGSGAITTTWITCCTVQLMVANHGILLQIKSKSLVNLFFFFSFMKTIQNYKNDSKPYLIK